MEEVGRDAVVGSTGETELHVGAVGSAFEKKPADEGSGPGFPTGARVFIVKAV